jgi:hypothetical protein
MGGLFGDDLDIGPGGGGAGLSGGLDDNIVAQTGFGAFEQQMRLSIGSEGPELGRSGAEPAQSQPGYSGSTEGGPLVFQEDESAPTSRTGYVTTPSLPSGLVPYHRSLRPPNERGFIQGRQDDGRGRTSPPQGMAAPAPSTVAREGQGQLEVHFALGASESAGAGLAGYPFPFIGPSVVYQSGGNNIFGAGLQGYTQTFIGGLGLGIMFVPVDISLTATMFFGSMRRSDALSAGCVPSVLFITPIGSLQLAPPALSLAVNWPPTLALGIFGGVACSATLDAPFSRPVVPGLRLP